MQFSHKKTLLGLSGKWVKMTQYVMKVLKKSMENDAEMLFNVLIDLFQTLSLLQAGLIRIMTP